MYDECHCLCCSSKNSNIGYSNIYGNPRSCEFVCQGTCSADSDSKIYVDGDSNKDSKIYGKGINNWDTDSNFNGYIYGETLTTSHRRGNVKGNSNGKAYIF